MSVLNKRITYLLTYLQQMHITIPVAATIVFYSICLGRTTLLLLLLE